MLHLCLSNDLHRLVELLAERLPVDPLERAFARPLVVVPDGLTATVIKDGLAERDGVCAGLRLPYLDRFLRSLLPDGVEELRVGALRGVLRDLILELDPDDAALIALQRYVDASAGDARWSDALAHRLGWLCLSYERDLPDMTARWRAGEAADPPDERLQAELFRRALARLATREDAAPRPLGSLLAEDPLDLSAVPDTVHVFLGRPLDQVRRAALVRVAQERDVVLYRLSRTADLEAGEPGLSLRWLWLRPELAEEATWRGLADAVSVERVAGAAPAGSVLAALRDEVAAPDDARPRLSPDASLTASSAPTRRHEVERAARALLARLADEQDAPGRPLQLHEVALLIPRGEEAYRPLIDSVFRAHGLPVRFLNGAAEGLLADLGGALLDLLGGRCERTQLVGVLMHPAVLAANELRRDQVVRWIDRLGIAFGLDARQQAGTYVADRGLDLFHAAAGARKLVLGAFCEGTVAGEARRVVLADGVEVPPHDVGPDERAAAARFALLLASLSADARAAQTDRPLSAWGPWLAELFGTYARPVDDRDERNLGRLQRDLTQLADDPGQSPVPFAVAAQAAGEQFARLRRSGSRHLAGGVLVSDALPPLRLRQVFVLGLGEAWPGVDEVDGLDLRGAPDRDPAAATRVRRAQAAFLDTLCAAERVALSWVDRDARGDERYPSPVVNDLRRFLSERILTPGASWPEPAAPDGPAPTAAPTLRSDLLDHLGQGVPAPPLATIRAGVSPSLRPALDARLGLLEPPAPAPIAGGAPTIELDLSALRGFLKSPLQQTAKRVAHLRERRVDGRRDRLSPTEPLEVDRLEASLLRQAVFLEGWTTWRARPAGERGGPIVLAALRARLAEAERVGRSVPTGPFLDVERQKHERLLTAWFTNALRAVVDGPTPALIAPRLGRAGDDAPVSSETGESLPALELEVPLPDRERPVRVVLSGRLGLLVGADAASARASVILSARARFDVARVVTDAFLTHTVLSAAGVRADRPLTAHVIGGTERKRPFRPASFAALSPDAARAWLVDLIADLLVGQWALLPIESVVDHRKKPGTTLRSHVLRARDAEYAWASCAYGPLTRLDGFEPPSEADALALVERRFGLFFQTSEGVL